MENKKTKGLINVQNQAQKTNKIYINKQLIQAPDLPIFEGNTLIQEIFLLS